MQGDTHLCSFEKHPTSIIKRKGRKLEEDSKIKAVLKGIVFPALLALAVPIFGLWLHSRDYTTLNVFKMGIFAFLGLGLILFFLWNDLRHAYNEFKSRKDD